MQRTALAGGGLALVGLVGYVVGIVTPYPGRAFSLSAVMVGVTLLVVARGLSGGEPA